MKRTKPLGTATLKDGEWIIEAKPHVMTLMRRVFGQARKSVGAIKLKNTPRICADLIWVSERYELEFNPKRSAQRSAKEHHAEIEAFARIMEGGQATRDFPLSLPPRDYQKVAAEIAIRSRGLLVADDLGTGKTCIGICLLALADCRPALVVTMTHLVEQWAREIERFCPELIGKVHVAKKGRPPTEDEEHKAARRVRRVSANKRIQPRLRDASVVVLNYHKLAGWTEALAPRLKAVIYDECQELRRDGSCRYGAAEKLAECVSYRLGLSATPVYNYGGEIFNILQVLKPDGLGTRDEFYREWCQGRWGSKASVADPKALGSFLRENGLMIRRTRADVGRELPEIEKVVHHVDYDPDALESISDDLSRLAELVLSAGGAPLEKMRASEELSWKLRQATGIAKAPFVAGFVRMLVETGEQILLFGWHREVYSIWQEIFNKAGINTAMHTGTETPKKKKQAIDDFASGEVRVLMMSLRSGAGVDGIQHACRTVVHGELDWSPGVHDQCLSEDTEILTRKGFLGVDEVFVGDEVCGFDIETNAMRWVRADRKVDRRLGDDEKMLTVATERLDVRVTDQHRMVVRRKRHTISGTCDSAWAVRTAGDLIGKSRRSVPVSGFEEVVGVDLTDYELRLLGWFIADGSFDGRALTIYQGVGQPWNVDLVEVLQGCGVKWTRYQKANQNGSVINMYVIPKGTVHRWSVGELAQLRSMRALGRPPSEIGHVLNRSTVAVEKKVRKIAAKGIGTPVAERTKRGWESLGPYLDKDLSPSLEQMTRRQLRSFLHGVYMGDGSKGRGRSLVKTMRITNTNKVFLDRLQSLCVRRGFAANIATRKGLTKAGKRIYDIWISDRLSASLPPPGKANALAEDPGAGRERVWCLSNELGTLITRRNGKVSVVGNCTGRVHRDGQSDPVTSYYLVADDGSDPVVADVLGLKRAQASGIINPEASVIGAAPKGVDRVKSLASEYLKRSTPSGSGLPRRRRPWKRTRRADEQCVMTPPCNLADPGLCRPCMTFLQRGRG